MSNSDPTSATAVAAERSIEVAALDDPRLADYRHVRERVLRQDGTFIAESDVVLRVLIERGRFPIRSLFIARRRLAKVAPLLARLPEDVPIYVGERALLNEVVGFSIHRGILAAGQRLPVPDAATLLDELKSTSPQRLVVLQGLTNHDNVGGVFRNAAAFGAAAVVYDKYTCDPLYRKAIRVSVGGALVVPFARAQSSETLLVSLRARGYLNVALSPLATALPVTALQQHPRIGGKVALWLGSEGPGLTAAVMAQADVLVKVTMAAGFDSLNVATTSGIALHRLFSAQRLRAIGCEH